MCVCVCVCVCRCEGALVTSVTVRNCIKLYQASEEHSAEALKKYCLQMISSHWVGQCSRLNG